MAVVNYWYQSVIRLAPALCTLIFVLQPVFAAAEQTSTSVSTVMPASTPTPAEVALADLNHAANRALHERLQTLQRYKANFTQVVEGGRGQIVERSSGRVVLARPNFHWSVAAPYPQHIVSNEAQLQVYDPDLAQVIIKPLANALQDTPVALLTSDDVALTGNFDVVMLSASTDQDDDVFVLTPRLADSLYSEIRLHFKGDELRQLGILDHLGQFTQIRFSEVERPAVVDSAEFVLDLPSDIDVIEG